ncbi:MAG: hypothetical protein LIP06_08430 [Tannerellaceae bacterium]|nr:hypothetical protein [Tannerellaceae bacterium]MCC8198580.1 hypothetical protein [Tannerellaceae bacterium]
MYLQLVTKRQANRLRRIGFNWKVKDIFILHTARVMFPDTMEIEDNWNQYEETLSRPSIPLALQWARETFHCKCEVTIMDWETDAYAGMLLFPDMQEPVSTRVFEERAWAENELLSKVIEYIISLRLAE